MGGPAPPPPLPLTEGQTYCLRWNNHKSNLVEILDALIKVESYVDCTIVVDDQVQFKAHRVVLAANSPYFQAILQDVPMDHCSIIFPGVKAFEMRALLEYMYTGEVNVTQSQIPKIMRIAEELEVKGLFDMADLKEKFNKMDGEEHAERNPYTSGTSAGAQLPYASVAATPSSTSLAQNGGKDNIDLQHTQKALQNSSSVISTSSNISPSAAPSSSSSPPYGSYKSPYSNLYSKSPGPLAASSSGQSASAIAAAAVAASTAAQASTHHTQSSTSSQQSSAERASAGQWPLSPSAAAAAMLSSVYESAPDMNPLKRKKLSSISSMLMNRDTPILRNVLAQANPADSSQSMPLLLPSSGGSGSSSKGEKISTDKNSPHTSMAGGTHNNNHTYGNGGDYSSDKKYHDEPHSPYTDRSFDDDNYDQKGNYSGSGAFGANSSSNQKPEWKRYKQYTRNDIMSAIQCVRDGMSALQASRKFGVPSRTLYDKVKKLGITTGRPMNRTMKRSPSNVESSAAFPYAHGYGQSETSAILTSMHEREREERGEPKEHHHRPDHHQMPPTIPHPAAALLDHAFLQQALESRGGDIAGREALHAMALAAAAHAAVNRMSTSPGPNGNGGRRSPSPPPSSYAMKYARPSEHEMYAEHDKEREMVERERELEREREREREDIDVERRRERERERERERGRDRDRDRDREHTRVERLRVRDHERENRERKLEREIEARERETERDADDEEDDHVEDLSVTRKDCYSPASRRPDSPYSPPPTTTILPLVSAGSAENSSGVIVPPISKLPIPPPLTTSTSPPLPRTEGHNSSDDFMEENNATTILKREIITDDGRAD